MSAHRAVVVPMISVRYSDVTAFHFMCMRVRKLRRVPLPATVMAGEIRSR